MDKPKVRTGLGKSDCPGSQGGCRKRGLFKEVRAPAFYPDRRGWNGVVVAKPRRNQAMNEMKLPREPFKPTPKNRSLTALVTVQFICIHFKKGIN